MAESPPLPQIEELLQHSGWLRRLAQRLVGEDMAEDLLQDTWLAALRRPPRAAESLPAWLATVLRNRAADHHRAGRRQRAWRERTESLPAVQTKPEDLAHQVELQTELSQEVLQLSEPLRQVILMRYFQGLPPRKIAAELDITVEAVRKRQQRALGLLRRRLAERHSGDWGETRVLFLPLAGGGGAPPVLPLLTKWSVPLMKKPLSSLAMVLLCLLGAAGIWLALGSRDPSGGPSPAQTIETAADREEAEKAAGAAQRDEIRREIASPVAEDPETLVLRGRVVDALRRPISGAWVCENAEGRTTTTGPDGSFEIETRRISRWRNSSIWAFREGYSLEGVPVPDGSATLIQLPPHKRRPVQVLDMETDTPIAGAEADLLIPVGDHQDWRADSPPLKWQSVPAKLAPSDAMGILVLPSFSGEIRVVRRGFETSIGTIERDDRVASALAGTPETVLLRRTGLDWKVRFVQDDGTPWSNSLLRLGKVTSRTDPDGWAPIPSMARWLGRGMAIQVGNRTWEFSLKEESMGFTGIRILPGATFRTSHSPVTGRISDSGGLSFQDLEVATALGKGTRNPERWSWQAVEADGTFRIRAGWQALRMGVLVRERESNRIIHFQRVVDKDQVLISLAEPLPVHLEVVSDNPASLDGSRVQLRAEQWGHSGPYLAPLLNGAADFHLRPGKYFVEFQAKEGKVSSKLNPIWVAAGKQDFSLKLGALRDVQGRVICKGEPVFPCKIQLVSRARGYSDWYATVHTDSEGRFRLHGIPDRPLSASLYPQDPWLAQHYNWNRQLPPNEDSWEIQLPYSELRIELTDHAGFQASQIFATCLDIETGEGLRSHWPPVMDLTHGPAEFRLTPCVLRLSDTGADFRRLHPREIVAAENESRTVQLRWEPLGILTVAISDYRCWQIDVEPECAPLDGQDPTHGYASEAFQVHGTHAAKLAPGKWRMTFRGPILDNSGEESVILLGEGEWSFETTVLAGVEQFLRLEISDDGNLVRVE